MKTILLTVSLLTAFVSGSALATTYKGKCAKQAENAALTKTDDEVEAVSAKINPQDSSSYEVLMRLVDDEDGLNLFTVTVTVDSSNCHVFKVVKQN